MTYRLTRHVLNRVRTRWNEPTDRDAERAARHVLEHGTWTPRRKEDGAFCVTLGTRRLIVVQGVAVTAILLGVKRMEHLRRRARRDMKERTRGRHA